MKLVMGTQFHTCEHNIDAVQIELWSLLLAFYDSNLSQLFFYPDTWNPKTYEAGTRLCDNRQSGSCQIIDQCDTINGSFDHLLLLESSKCIDCIAPFSVQTIQVRRVAGQLNSRRIKESVGLPVWHKKLIHRRACFFFHLFLSTLHHLLTVKVSHRKFNSGP